MVYFIIINLYGLGIIYKDKNRAKNKKWRIPEKRLFKTALLGGSIGIFIGMKNFRHKTKHKSFTLGIPAIIIGQLIVIFYLYTRF